MGNTKCSLPKRFPKHSDSEREWVSPDSPSGNLSTGTASKPKGSTGYGGTLRMPGW